MTRETILLIEDEPMLREAFKLMLEDSSYTVHEAGTGAHALELARAAQPALALLDLGLPDMSGLDVARALKADPNTENIVLVALTGRVGPDEKQACLDAGCAAYFAKPFSPKELLKRLPDLLGK